MTRVFGRTLCALALCLAAVSCQTASKSEPDGLLALPPGSEFLPMTFVAPIQVGRGNYPDLFAEDSTAVWVGSDVADLRQAKALEDGDPVSGTLAANAQRVTDNFLVFECDIASVFGDMSIAYDVVGFRGISVYLLTPDGRTVAPIQTVIGTPVREQQQQALKRYSRTNMIVFEKKDLVLGNSTIAPDAPAVRLVLQGYDSVFYFEWQASPTPNESWKPTRDEYVRAVKVGFKEFCEKTARLAHIFD
ncbi:MAG: hypothetical protein GWP08_01120 [Nitrospiraceae bacterium]|nr:hypothetical protein [Nitrospiraceae bacterium]